MNASIISIIIINAVMCLMLLDTRQKLIETRDKLTETREWTIENKKKIKEVTTAINYISTPPPEQTNSLLKTNL